MSGYRELKEQVWECNLQLPEHGLVLYTFGNVSAVDRNRGVMAIKPSGVPYNRLKPEDMVVLDLENNLVEGKLNPSSDTRTHLVLYNSFPEIGGVVHTHATYSTAWAQAMKSIPIMGTTHADHLTTDVPCTGVMGQDQIEGNYEEETGRQIIKAFADLSYKEVEMVLVACHRTLHMGCHTGESCV